MKFNFKKMIDSQIVNNILNYELENDNTQKHISYLKYHQNIINIISKPIFTISNELSDKISTELNNNELIDCPLSAPSNNNCLALTIKKDYKLTSIINVAERTFRMSFKVLVSCVALNLLKLFFTFL